MREVVLAALRRDPELVTKLTESLRGKPGEDQGPFATVGRAAGALEPILADALRRKPSRLTQFGLKSAQVLAGLAAEDKESSERLAAIAQGGKVGIVFVDVVGFTTMTEARGDKVAIELLDRLAVIVERKARTDKGELVKQLGDGFLIAFPSAARSVKGAIALRDAVASETEKDPDFDLMVRISVHAGEPLVQGNDLLGHDVNLAARVLDHCKPGKILISEAAKEMAEKRLRRIAFGRRRLVKIRGLSTKVAVYPVKGYVPAEST